MIESVGMSTMGMEVCQDVHTLSFSVTQLQLEAALH